MESYVLRISLLAANHLLGGDAAAQSKLHVKIRVARR
jgi:hypothetical protein